MKRAWIQVLGGIAFVCACAVFGLWMWLRPTVMGDITAAFAEDVRDYVVAHGGNMPPDWMKFCDWMRSTQNSQRWRAEDLNRRFVIRCSSILDAQSVARPVEIVDPSLAGMQDFMDRIVLSAALDCGFAPKQP